MRLVPLQELLEGAAVVFATARRVVAFWGPVVDVPAVVAPAVAIGALIALALLTGVAMGSMATLIVALVVLYALLRDVFGVRIDLDLA